MLSIEWQKLQSTLATGAAPLFNVGSGTDLSIAELAAHIARAVDFLGALTWDRTKPDGTPQKLLNISNLESLGWHPEITLYEGLRAVYREFSKIQTDSEVHN